MKIKILALIYTIFIAISGAWAQLSEVKFDKESHNFGKIEEDGGLVSHTFKYNSNSETPYVILEVQTSCGCTTPEFSKEPILKGGGGDIKITYDPMNRPGRILKTIIVVSNLGVTKLYIDGTVNPRERSLEERFPFIVGGGARIDLLSYSRLRVPKGDTVEVEVGVANNNSSTDVTVSTIESELPEGVSVEFSTKKLSPKQEGRMLIKIIGVKYGLFSHNIPLVINNKRGMERIIINGGVIDNFEKWSRSEVVNAPKARYSNLFVRCGVIKKDSRITKRIEVFNDGKSDLVVRTIESSALLEVEMQNKVIKPGTSAYITIVYTPNQEGYDSQVVRLVLNDNESPMPEIRLVAEVRGE